MGEGMSIQIARDGRRILWLAHESAPKNFTGVDDPYEPPVSPELTVRTLEHSPEEAAKAIVDFLIKERLLVE